MDCRETSRFTLAESFILIVRKAMQRVISGQVNDRKN